MTSNTRLRITYPLSSIALLMLHGRLDVSSARPVQEAVRDIVANSRALWAVVDLDHVDFLDSAGLATLVSLATQLRRRGGGVGLVRVGRSVQRILETAGEEDRFRMFPNEGQAYQALLASN